MPTFSISGCFNTAYTMLVLVYLKLSLKDLIILSFGDENRAKMLSAFAVDFNCIVIPWSVFDSPISKEPTTKKLLNFAFN